MKAYPKGLLCGDGKGIKLDDAQLPQLLSDNFKVEVELTPTNKDVNYSIGQMFLSLGTGTYIRVYQNNFHFRVATKTDGASTNTSSQIMQVTIQNNVRYKVTLEVSSGVVTFTISGSNGDFYEQRITLAAGTVVVTTPFYALGMWSTPTDRREFYGVMHNVKFYNGGQLVLAYNMEGGTMPGPLSLNYGSYIVPKSAVKYPKKNIAKPFKDWNTLASEMVVTAPYKAKMSASQASRFSMLNLDLKLNTVYTVKANHNGRLGVYKNGTTAVRAYGTEQTFTFNSGQYDQLSLYFNNAVPGDFFLEDVMVYEGTEDVPFSPYDLGTKSSKKYPSQNLIPDFTKWNLINAKATIDSPYKLILNPTAAWTSSNVVVDVKPNTLYTLTREDASGIVYCSELDSNGNQVKSTNTSNNTSLEITTTSSTAKIRVIYDNGNTSSGVFTLTRPQLKEGKAAEFKPYEEGLKPAILYPINNLLTKSWLPYRSFDKSFPADDVAVSSSGDVVTVVKSGTTAMASQKVSVKANTDYELYFTNDSGIDGGWYVYNAIGTLLFWGVQSNLVKFNSGNNTDLVIGLFKGSSYNASPSIKFYKPVLVEGSRKAFEAGMKSL